MERRSLLLPTRHSMYQGKGSLLYRVQTGGSKKCKWAVALSKNVFTANWGRKTKHGMPRPSNIYSHFAVVLNQVSGGGVVAGGRAATGCPHAYAAKLQNPFLPNTLSRNSAGRVGNDLKDVRQLFLALRQYNSL